MALWLTLSRSKPNIKVKSKFIVSEKKWC